MFTNLLVILLIVLLIIYVQQYSENFQMIPIVYQGHGIPLEYESTPTLPVKSSMFIFSDKIAKPECCPSYYSTDRGCICVN